MRLKVCGITIPEELEQLAEAQVDYAGLIFVPTSSRYVREKLKAEDVRRTSIKKVGVFVNEDMDNVMATVEGYGLAAVQLHGDEDPDLTARINEQIPVFKAFRVKEDDNIDELILGYESSCSFYLFDTFAKGNYGGTGKRFDWKKLDQAKIGKEFFLSGGITPDDVHSLKEVLHRYLYAADINSGFELSPGVKDMKKVREFQKALNL